MNLNLLLPGLLLIVQIFLGIYVLIQKLKSKSGISFAFFCFSLSAWSFASFMLWNANDLWQVAFWGKYIFFGPVLIAYFFLFFSLVFPEGKISASLAVLMALPTIVFFSLMPTNLILKSSGVALNGPVAIWGEAYPFFALYFIFYVVLGFLNLIKKSLLSKGSERKQLFCVSTGLFFAFMFGIIFNLILPALGETRFISIGPYFTLALIGLTAYAIVKHRLMDISVVISRTFAEILTIISLGAIYFSIVWFFSTYVATGLSLPLILAVLIYGVFVGHNYLKMRLFFQTSTDKAFLHGKYDYYKALSEASRRVGEKLSLATILGIMYQTFTDVVEISNPRVFLPEHFTNPEVPSKRYVIYDKQTFLPMFDGEAIDLNDKLVEHLVASRQPILDPHNPERELIVPCMLEDRLIAIFVLGRKLSEDPYTDEDIKLIEVLANQAAISLDHTRSYEKITADLEAAENQLSRSQRLASLGTLMAGVTHEIRNPLTVIRAETERLKDHPEFRDLVLRHVDRIAGIVQRMLSMAKEKPKEESEVNLNEAIESALQLVSLKNVKVIKAFQAVPLVKGVQGEIEEVFMNLIQNATESMQGNGTLTLKTYVEEGRVIAEVTDTGKGIPEELREKIFDPFFSTRHEGTGLGLSIVYRIIKEMGGDIKIVSEEGKWTTFKVTF